jgi:hypothetical protein
LALPAKTSGQRQSQLIRLERQPQLIRTRGTADEHHDLRDQLRWLSTS